jgi:hypothetical protein
MVHCWKRHNIMPVIIPGGRIGVLVAGLSGFGITLFAMGLAMIPPPGTTDVLVHEAKLGGGSLLLIGLGQIIYWRARAKQRRPVPSHNHPMA